MPAGKNMGSLERIFLLHISMRAFAWVCTQRCPWLEMSSVCITYPLLLRLFWVGVMKVQCSAHRAGYGSM